MPKPAVSIRTAASIGCSLVLCLAAMTAIVKLEQRADASRGAQVQVATLKNDLGEALTASWNASTDVGGNPVVARQMLDEGERGFNRTFTGLRRAAPLPVLGQIPPVLRAEYSADETIYRIGSTRGYGSWINSMEVPQNVGIGRLFGLLDTANHQYADHAAEARTLSTIGTVAAIVALLMAFLVAYRRAIRLASLNRQEAVTDALTGLANRRALIDALQTALDLPAAAHPLTLALFDLDGFKQWAIPDAILNKPGPLDPDEWKLIHRHTLLGERIMLAAPALAGVAKLVRSGHERVDGAGYPDGLRGDQIPIGARIIFVCDAFDAMTSQRPYNEPMDVEEALAELRRCAGSQFDPRVVETFTAVARARVAATELLAA